jgi:hypothetical protein
MSQEFVGDYSLKSVLLTKDRQQIEIKELVSEINIYESVNSVATSADMVVSDNKNILDSLPIQGGEQITITVGTNKDEYILQFVIYKIDSKVQQEKSQIYICRLCTEDTIKNEQSRYSVRHKNEFPENIVTDLLKNRLGSNKPIDADKTIYPVNFVNPYWRIWDVCNWISRKSVPRQNVESCGFLFFETLKGYNFKSIDNLFSRKSLNEDNPFVYSQAKTNSGGDKNNRIRKFVSTDYFDMLEEIRMGTLGHYTRQIEFNNRSMKLSKSSMSLVWNNMSHLGGGQIPIDNTNKLINNPSRTIYTPILSNLFGTATVGDPSDTDKINVLLDRSIYRYHSMDFYTVSVEIAGNLGIRAGGVYTLYIPSPNPDTSVNRERQVDAGMSGNWMCHSIKTTINRTESTTIVKFCRDSNGSDSGVNIPDISSSKIDNDIYNI